MVCSAQQPAQTLADILEQKGILNASDRARVRSGGEADGIRILTAILQERGLLNTEDVARVLPGQPAVQVVPAVYNTASTAAPQTPAQPQTAGNAVTTAFPVLSKIPIQFYGTMLLNAFYNTSLNNNEDVPSFAGKQGSDATGGDKNFAMTARQTRFGINYSGPQSAGARLSGTAEFDFLSGSGTVANGTAYYTPRLRLAFGRLDWKNASLEAGQDWSIFAPLNPTSFASYGIAALNASGNLWVREPQVRLDLRHTMSETSKLLFQFAVTDSNEGDNTATFNSSRTAGTGERGRIPSLESRASFTASGITFGLSGHYGRGKNAGLLGTRNIQTGVDSWGVAGDWSVPIGRRFILTGEAFEGRSLGLYGGSLGQSILPVGTPGQHGVETRGGWTQAQVNFTKQWQMNLDYGIEVPNAHNSDGRLAGQESNLLR